MALTRSPMKRRYKPTGPTSEVVDALLERCNFHCELCGFAIDGDRRGVDWSVQHRIPRGAGGTRWTGINSPSNLMIFDGSGTTGCHGFVERERAAALRVGWLLPKGSDPSQHAALIGRERWVYLGDDFRYHDSPPERAG